MVHGLDRGCPAVPRHPHERYQACYQEGKRQRSAGIFPDRNALICLVGAVLAEQHDEWTEMRRYIGLDILAKSRLTKITDPNPTDPEVTITAITA